MRLIDADALLLEFGEEPLNWTNSDSEIQAQRDYRLFTKIVKDAPTVDIKTEVAKIFEEIEKNIQAKINSIPVDEWEEDFFTGERSALVKLAHDIAKLKNKYIEGVE